MPKKEFRKLGKVFRRPTYIITAVLISAVAFSLYALLLNYSLLWSTISSGNISLAVSLVPVLVLGYAQTTTTFSIIMSVLISLAVGINFALVVFKIIEMASIGTEGASSMGGMALAVIAPACPACATTIFAFAGLSSFLAILPFKGTEIKVLALLLLTGSAFYITRQIDKQVCQI